MPKPPSDSSMDGSHDPLLMKMANQYALSLFEGDSLYFPTQAIYTSMISHFPNEDVVKAITHATNILRLLGVEDKRATRNGI